MFIKPLLWHFNIVNVHLSYPILYGKLLRCNP